MTKTYIIDFDSTLATIESLDELARIALNGRPGANSIISELEDITNQGMLGEIGIDESLERRLNLFKANRKHVKQLVQLLHTRFSPSAIANIEWFRNNADRIYVVSSGFEDYIKPVIEELGLIKSRVFANRFIYDDSGNISGYDPSSLLSQPLGKVNQVKSLGLNGKVIMIGDGYTDYEVKARGAADEFWACTETVERPKVTAHADRVINDFSEIV